MDNVMQLPIYYKQNMPRYVFIDFEFFRIGEIDTSGEKFTAEICYTLTWIESGIINKYDKSKYWNPQIYIENSFIKPDETVELRTAPLADGVSTSIIEKHTVKGSFWERQEIQNFPVDVQDLTIVLATKLDAKQIKLVGRSLHMGKKVLNTFVDQQRWRLLQLVECTADVSYDGQANADDDEDSYMNRVKLSFKAFACRRPYYFYANAYFLIFLITASAISIFSVDCKLPQNRLQINTIILLTSVSFKWVVNRSMPTVNYTTTLDQYTTTSILYLCLLSAWHAIVGTHWSKTFAQTVDKWMLLGLSCLFIFIHFLFAIKLLRGYLYVWDAKKREKRFKSNLKMSRSKNYLN